MLYFFRSVKKEVMFFYVVLSFFHGRRGAPHQPGGLDYLFLRPNYWPARLRESDADKL